MSPPTPWLKSSLLSDRTSWCCFCCCCCCCCRCRCCCCFCCCRCCCCCCCCRCCCCCCCCWCCCCCCWCWCYCCCWSIVPLRYFSFIILLICKSTRQSESDVSLLKVQQLYEWRVACFLCCGKILVIFNHLKLCVAALSEIQLQVGVNLNKIC